MVKILENGIFSIFDIYHDDDDEEEEEEEKYNQVVWSLKAKIKHNSHNRLGKGPLMRLLLPQFFKAQYYSYTCEAEPI